MRILVVLLLLVSCKPRLNSTSQSLSGQNHHQFASEPGHILNLAQKYKHMQDPIAEIIKYIHPAIMQRFSLVHSTNGQQEGTPQYPRVIVARPDGGYYLSWNGGYQVIRDSSTQRERILEGWNTLEQIYKVPDSPHMQAAEIKFVKRQQGSGYEIEYSTVYVDPTNSRNNIDIGEHANCTGCHGDRMYPIARQYPTWKEWYGSRDDILDSRNNLLQSGNYDERYDAEELKAITAEHRLYTTTFHEQKLTNPRYSVLFKNAPSFTGQSSDIDREWPFSLVTSLRKRGETRRPNLVATEIFTETIAESILQYVRFDAQYAKLKKSAFLLRTECFNPLRQMVSGQSTTIDNMLALYRRIFSDKLRVPNFFQEGVYVEDFMKVLAPREYWFSENPGTLSDDEDRPYSALNGKTFSLFARLSFKFANSLKLQDFYIVDDYSYITVQNAGTAEVDNTFAVLPKSLDQSKKQAFCQVVEQITLGELARLGGF